MNLHNGGYPIKERIMTSLKDYQTQDAKYQLLYDRKWFATDKHPREGGIVTNVIEVRLIAWTSGSLEMIVLLSRVMVDGDVVVESAKVLHDIAVTDAIETAMKQFAKLAESHPGMPLAV
jgi:hypothetical protein